MALTVHRPCTHERPHAHVQAHKRTHTHTHLHRPVSGSVSTLQLRMAPWGAKCWYSSSSLASASKIRQREARSNWSGEETGGCHALQASSGYQDGCAGAWEAVQMQAGACLYKGRRFTCGPDLRFDHLISTAHSNSLSPGQAESRSRPHLEAGS